MNQERGDCVATYLGLQGFKVVTVERVQHPRRGLVKVVRIERQGGQHECPQCGRRQAAGLFAEHEPIRLRDCSIGDLETYIEVRPMRIGCCGATRVERLPFAAPGFRMTRRFFERIAALCTRMPVAAVAQMAKLSWATVAKVDGRAIELGLGDRSAALVDLSWIGIDEVSRTGGRVYFTIVTNLRTGRVVWIGDGKGRKGMLPFLRALGRQGRRRLRGVVSDLGYRTIITRQLPHVVHVLDRFHIVQWVNEALNGIRRRLFTGAPRDEVGRTFKAKKWLLLSARENLEHKDKLLLTGLMELNQPLYQAYLLKEQLRAVLRHPWKYIGVLRNRLHEWILGVFETTLPELARVAHRIANHLDAVIAGHEHAVPLGMCEAINGKIAVLRRQARGYRDPEYFKLKIFQRCSMPDNPWASIVL
ncbi:MAG: ISL3 family transposase [Dokdonella sp.]